MLGKKIAEAKLVKVIGAIDDVDAAYIELEFWAAKLGFSKNSAKKRRKGEPAAAVMAASV